jgi:LemA protein
MTPSLIILIVVVAIALFAVAIYNSIISVKNTVEEASSAIDTVFQNRYDLIPNLVQVVQQYTSHEKDILENVTKIRSNAMNNQEVTKEKLEQENMLS